MDPGANLDRILLGAAYGSGPETTLYALLVTSVEVLVCPPTLVLAVQSLCPGMRPKYPSWGLCVVRYLGIYYSFFFFHWLPALSFVMTGL